MSLNLRRDHSSLATFEFRYSPEESQEFQSQARPPLPCHQLPPINLQDDGLVSISGETTAPLPRTESYSLQGACSPFQSQARPPLPCHSSSTRPRFVPGWVQSQARPPLPCHKNNLLVRTPYHP